MYYKNFFKMFLDIRCTCVLMNPYPTICFFLNRLGIGTLSLGHLWIRSAMFVTLLDQTEYVTSQLPQIFLLSLSSVTPLLSFVFSQ